MTEVNPNPGLVSLPSGMGATGGDIGRISFPHEERFNKGLQGKPRERLSHDVSRVFSSRDVFKAEPSSSNGFADSVVGQSIPAFGQGGMRNGGAGHTDLLSPNNQAGPSRGTPKDLRV